MNRAPLFILVYFVYSVCFLKLSTIFITEWNECTRLTFMRSRRRKARKAGGSNQAAIKHAFSSKTHQNLEVYDGPPTLDVKAKHTVPVEINAGGVIVKKFKVPPFN